MSDTPACPALRNALLLASAVCLAPWTSSAGQTPTPSGFSLFSASPTSLSLSKNGPSLTEVTISLPPSYISAQDAAEHASLRLASSGDWAGRTLYFDVGYGPDSGHVGSGFAWGDAYLGFVSGSSEHAAQDLAPVFGLGAPYLSGLYPIEYRYSSIGLAREWGEAGLGYAGALRMESPGRVDHQVLFGGVIAGRFSADYLSVDQRGTEIGSALGIGWHLPFASLGYQLLRSDDGEKLHRFRLSGAAGRCGDLALQYETGKSPFTAREEERILLSLRSEWGPRGIFSQNAAAATGDPEAGKAAAKQARAGWVTAAAVGGAAIAAALVAGAGGDEENEGKGGSGFAKQHDAAFAVLNAINPVSVRENREYGGWIYREHNGTYGYTIPVRGSPDGVDPGTPSSVPTGTSATAGYHTHAAFDPRYDNENFSPQDIAFANFHQVDEYLGTPAGAFKYYEYATGNIVTLGRIAH